MLSNNQFLLRYVILCACFLTAISCGDIFAKREQIYKDYYVIQGDIGEDISVCFKVDQNSFVGRVPPKAIEYALLGDSLLIVKSKQKADTFFYILNMKLDNPSAEEKAYLVGPLTAKKYLGWREKLTTDLNFVKIK